MTRAFEIGANLTKSMYRQILNIPVLIDGIRNSLVCSCKTCKSKKSKKESTTSVMMTRTIESSTELLRRDYWQTKFTFTVLSSRGFACGRAGVIHNLDSYVYQETKFTDEGAEDIIHWWCHRNMTSPYLARCHRIQAPGTIKFPPL